MADTQAIRQLAYITLADRDYRPLGILELHRTGWTVCCDVCLFVQEVETPEVALNRLIAHIGASHCVVAR